MFLANELDALELAFIARLRNYGSLSLVEQYKTIAALDFFQELMSEAGLSDVLNDLESDYINIIRMSSTRMPGVSAITLSELEILMDLDAEAILRSGQGYSNVFKSRMLKSMIFGEDINAILADFRIPEFKHNWNIAAIQTAKDQFHAAAVGKIYEESPEQRFELTGPLDGKTRCECRAVLDYQKKGGWTRAEINKGEATKIVKQHCPKVKPESQIYDWIGRGGFNCRHYWEPTELSDSFVEATTIGED